MGTPPTAISPSILRKLSSDIHIPCKTCASKGVQQPTCGVCDGCREVMCEPCFKTHTKSCGSAPSSDDEAALDKSRTTSSKPHRLSVVEDIKVINPQTLKPASPLVMKIINTDEMKCSTQHASKPSDNADVTREDSKVLNVLDPHDLANANVRDPNSSKQQSKSETEAVTDAKVVAVDDSQARALEEENVKSKLKQDMASNMQQDSSQASSSRSISSEESTEMNIAPRERSSTFPQNAHIKRPLLRETSCGPVPIQQQYSLLKHSVAHASTEEVKSRQSANIVTRKKLERCKQHVDEIVTHFCQKHETLTCKVCLDAEHKKCDVVDISDIAQTFGTSEEYETIKSSLSALQDNLAQIVTVTYENKQKTLKNKENVLEQIKNFRVALDEFLDKWEAKMNKETEHMFKEILSQQESILTKSTAMNTDTETTLGYLQTLEKNPEETNKKLFICAKNSKDLLEDYTAKVKQLELETVQCSITFHPNATIQKVFQSERRLGHMSLKQEPFKPIVNEKKSASMRRNASMEKTCYETITASPAGHIDVKLSGDLNNCDIFGLAVINEDKIAAVDNSNSSVKIIDLRKDKVVSDIKLSSAPWDITLLPKSRLAVTLPGKKAIQILSASGSLSKVSQLKVDGYCHGIDYCDEHLIIAMNTYPSKIVIMKLNGQVKKTIATDDNGANLFMSCQDIAINKTTRDIYVSDTYSSSYCITRLSWEGKVTGVYKHSVRCETRGLVVLDSGSIAVCYFDLNRILLVSPDLKSSRNMLHKKDGILRPKSLAIGVDQDTLFVGSKDKNCLDVFDLT